MNRNKVIYDDVTFKEFKRMNTKQPIKLQEDPDMLSIDSIIKFSKDKKNIKSDRRRKEATKELLLEYLDIRYNVDDFF